MIYSRMCAAIITAFLCVSSLYNHHGASAWVQDRRYNIPQNRRRALQPRNNLAMDVEAPTGTVTVPHGFSFGKSVKKLWSVPQTTNPSRHRISSGRSQHKADDLDDPIIKAANVPPIVRGSFLGSSSRPTNMGVKRNGWTTDFEENTSVDMASREVLEKLLFQEETGTASRKVEKKNLDEAQAIHGMPWKTSIDPAVQLKDGEDLLYMPFWEWQTDFMKEHLTDLEVVSCSNGETDFGYNENVAKKARIVSVCVRSAEYRKIRLTYYDAGDNTQVFNAVWYPDPQYNLPILGVDLLAFNRKKYLAIVDFQPLHTNEEDHAQTFEDLLAPIKEKYDTLKGKMSSKFYDETKFFSQQMLFARFDDGNVVNNELFPAFQQYAKMHLDLIRTTPANTAEADFVLERQQAYDTYSAERDPATGLFTAMFGKQWATDFVYDFLFSMSERPLSEEANSQQELSSTEEKKTLNCPKTIIS